MVLSVEWVKKKNIMQMFRVICTSTEPMEKLLEQGKLRSDLFHRLNVLVPNVPPLRERVEDIQLLNGRFYRN